MCGFTRLLDQGGTVEDLNREGFSLRFEGDEVEWTVRTDSPPRLCTG